MYLQPILNTQHNNIYCSFKGPKPKSNKIIKPYKANFTINQDYEGYISFYTKNNKKKDLIAHYDIYNNTPSIKPKESFNADFILNYITKAEKIDKSAKTYIKQQHNSPLSTETDLVAKITKLSDDGYKASISELPQDITLNIDCGNDIEIGDKILASGFLDCKLKK